jgi:membrane fusion protein (multidrug efflux system)
MQQTGGVFLKDIKSYLRNAGKIRPFIWAAAITIGLVLLALQIIKRTEESSALALSLEREAVSAKTVEVMPVQPSVWETWKSCYGQARAAKVMEVTSFVREIVETVHVNVGDTVQNGQVLLTLRREDQAAGERAGAAAYAEAKKAYERLSALCKEGGVSQAEADRAYAAMKSQEANFQNYRSTLRQTQIRSKISGTVTNRRIEPGEIADIGQTLLSVEDSSDMEAQLMVSIKDIGGINADTPVKVTAGGAAFSGKVRRVSPKAQNGSGLCPVTVALPPSAGVLPGTYLEGSFLIRRETGAIVIPSSSVLDRGGERFVYIVSGSGLKTARLTRIETGSGKSGKVVATSGLSSGDLLITSGSRGLSDGMAVSYDHKRDGVN